MDIKLIDVTKKIGNNVILDGVSLTIKQGETSLIVGKNGAGKTTMIRIILNLYQATSGKVFVNKVDVNSSEYTVVRNKIGFLMDNIGLFKDLTAWQNLEFFDRIYFPKAPHHHRVERITKRLKEVELYNKKDEKITFFSRGMRQRLAIARSLINNPKLLILDEPSRGLDIEGKELLKEYIKRLQKEKCTILINSHDLNDFQHICTNLSFLKDGKIICSGTYRQLQDKYGVNTYSLKINEIEKYKIELMTQNFVNSVDILDEELIINLNGNINQLSNWLSKKSIPIIELKKINDDLVYLYKKIIG
ncbi:ABC transporter ATP-binding protein [Clostridium estertheticum]|uniref:ABC transporter ATP-binding protein n=1 Tax=Clostridium estertheticum TaxID=238834 RepID=UPI001CF10068|nr:ABC transporter ATP-binding protein [Clostridium estertheticum]MCB2362191.1 ABC transporter ATP-binding protein [Clostridium estertheticum]